MSTTPAEQQGTGTAETQVQFRLTAKAMGLIERTGLTSDHPACGSTAATEAKRAIQTAVPACVHGHDYWVSTSVTAARCIARFCGTTGTVWASHIPTHADGISLLLAAHAINRAIAPYAPATCD